MKIAIIVGNRPHFVKLAALLPVLGEAYDCVIIHTGQHYSPSMFEAFFDQLSLQQPNYNLGVGSGSTIWKLGTMIRQLEPVLSEVKPELAMVIGDTTSSLAAALTTALLYIPVAHVEAGARSRDRREFEEVSRRLIDVAANFYFCPNEEAATNLVREGATLSHIYVVGDLLKDALRLYLPEAVQKSEMLDRLILKPGQFVLFTCHKSPNLSNPARLRAIIQLVEKVNMPVVWPIHPGSRLALEAHGILAQVEKSPNVILVEPIAYLDMLMLEWNAAAIITDSSGVQREAYYLNKPLLVLSSWTEHHFLREERLCKLLSDTDSSMIATALQFLAHNKVSEIADPTQFDFGNRTAAMNIAAAVDHIYHSHTMGG